MKKMYIVVFLFLVLFSVLSCVKTETKQLDIDYVHRAVPIENTLKSSGYSSGSYLLAGAFGHPAEGCGGCIMFGGKSVHRDCSGHGNACGSSSAVSVYSASAGYYNAVTTGKYGFTDEDFFLMPDRSFLVVDKEDNQLWLNIPEQLSIRDTATMQFTFYNLYFSNYQVFDND
ncbi:MAG: hypothetical protein LBQ22_00085 [Bacteroidales bacterium]|jgi:hypothetical protein|nr:hypothetical protein [Bacteroidales bacterium]